MHLQPHRLYRIIIIWIFGLVHHTVAAFRPVLRAGHVPEMFPGGGEGFYMRIQMSDSVQTFIWNFSWQPLWKISGKCPREPTCKYSKKMSFKSHSEHHVVDVSIMQRTQTCKNTNMSGWERAVNARRRWWRRCEPGKTTGAFGDEGHNRGRCAVNKNTPQRNAHVMASLLHALPRRHTLPECCLVSNRLIPHWVSRPAAMLCKWQTHLHPSDTCRHFARGSKTQRCD